MKKRDYIIISFLLVVLLTTLTLRISFSYISQINSNTTIRKITSGNLNIKVDVNNLENVVLLPKDENELPNGENDIVLGDYASVNITNNGNLNSIYDIYINYDKKDNEKIEDFISFKYLLIGIYDKTENKWLKYDLKYYLDFENILNETNNYKIITKSIKERDELKESHNYNIYVWLKKDTPKSEIGKLVKLKIDVDSRVDN